MVAKQVSLQWSLAFKVFLLKTQKQVAPPKWKIKASTPVLLNSDYCNIPWDYYKSDYAALKGMTGNNI